jgi:FkbM family methyltransferase
MARRNRNRLLARLWAVLSLLDRPGRRWLLVVPASIWLSLRFRTPCLVYWRDGAWIHRYPGAAIPHASLGRASPPAVFTAEAREIFLHGYAPRAGDTVVDVGAGVGAETLLFSRLVGRHGRVVSLEAHPRTFERLARLCSVNRLANVTPLQLAATDADGDVVISDYDHYLQNTLIDAGNRGIDVQGRRLETVAGELGITGIDLLKMNIEGAETVALAGLGDVIRQTRHVCISCHDFLADDGGAEELRTKGLVRAFLVEHGFRVESRDDAPEPWLRDYVYGENAQST